MSLRVKGRWMLVPVLERLTPATVYEHTPLAAYRHGEYPRFIRPVGAHQPRSEWKFIPAQVADLTQERSLGHWLHRWRRDRGVLEALPACDHLLDAHPGIAKIKRAKEKP